MAVTLIFIFPQGIWAIKNGTVCWMDNIYNMSLILSPFSINFKFNFVIWHTWTSLCYFLSWSYNTQQLASLSVLNTCSNDKGKRKLFRRRHFCLGSFQLIGKKIFSQYNSLRNFHMCDVISVKQWFHLENLSIFLYSPAFVRLSQCLAILKTPF